MRQAEPETILLPSSDGVAPQGVELRHLRYFVAVADAGTFHRPADAEPADPAPGGDGGHATAAAPP